MAELVRVVFGLGFLALLFALTLAVLRLFSIERTLKRMLEIMERKGFGGNFFPKDEE